MNTNIIKRVFDDMSECVFLSLNGDFYEGVHDIVSIHIYICSP